MCVENGGNLYFPNVYQYLRCACSPSEEGQSLQQIEDVSGQRFPGRVAFGAPHGWNLAEKQLVAQDLPERENAQRLAFIETAVGAVLSAKMLLHGTKNQQNSSEITPITRWFIFYPQPHSLETKRCLSGKQYRIHGAPCKKRSMIQQCKHNRWRTERVGQNIT